jgi:hypothetical protein
MINRLPVSVGIVFIWLYRHPKLPWKQHEAVDRPSHGVFADSYNAI